MAIFFKDEITNNIIILNEEESRHCVKVLRIKTGEQVTVTNGKGEEVNCILINNNPKQCELEVVNKYTHSTGRNYYLHLAVAPAKSNERIEWLIEKAVETGVDEISFIETKNTERTKINIDRLNKIAISAIKQSKQWWLPKINGVVNYSEFINNNNTTAFTLIAHVGSNSLSNFKQIAGVKNIIILVGPEGDFTEPEIHMAHNKGFKSLWLGKNILRTETAALYACMGVKIIFDNELC